jgi:hypothetical protein
VEGAEIERHPHSGNYVIVAVTQFSKKDDPQAEGITFAADGTLIIADEEGEKRGRLTLYPAHPPGSDKA